MTNTMLRVVNNQTKEEINTLPEPKFIPRIGERWLGFRIVDIRWGVLEKRKDYYVEATLYVE